MTLKARHHLKWMQVCTPTLISKEIAKFKSTTFFRTVTQKSLAWFLKNKNILENHNERNGETKVNLAYFLTAEKLWVEKMAVNSISFLCVEWIGKRKEGHEWW